VLAVQRGQLDRRDQVSYPFSTSGTDGTPDGRERLTHFNIGTTVSFVGEGNAALPRTQRLLGARWLSTGFVMVLAWLAQCSHGAAESWFVRPTALRSRWRVLEMWRTARLHGFCTVVPTICHFRGIGASIGFQPFDQRPLAHPFNGRIPRVRKSPVLPPSRRRDATCRRVTILLTARRRPTRSAFSEPSRRSHPTVRVGTSVTACNKVPHVAGEIIGLARATVHRRAAKPAGELLNRRPYSVDARIRGDSGATGGM